MIYDKIYEFCKVRNKGNCFRNGSNPTPRVEFLLKLLDELGIKYELDIFEKENRNFTSKHRHFDDDIDDDDEKRKEFYRKMMDRYKGDRGDRGRPNPFRSKNETFYNDFTNEDDSNNKFFNIIMKGTSSKMIVAHHDVNNHTIDNANDNSASVINIIASKLLRPEVNAVILDGEEFGGIGSERLSQKIKDGYFGNIEWVLNFELTGSGGEYFFIGDYPGALSNKIKSIFNCPVVRTPFNDSEIFKRNGIDTTVINSLPPLLNKSNGSRFFADVFAPDGTQLDVSILGNCHNAKDNINSISSKDMKEFVEKVILKII